MLFHVKRFLSRAAILGLSVIGGSLLRGADAIKLIPENISLFDSSLLWDRVFDVRTGFGYKDNVLLSPFHPQASPFFLGGLQATAIRLPLDGPEVVFFLDAEELRYTHPVNADKEQTLMSLAQIKKSFGPGWQVGAAMLYFYQDQLQDVSFTETNRTAVQVQGHNLTFRPSLRRDLGTNAWMQLELQGTRLWLKQPLDSYWQAGPKFTLTREYGYRSEVRLSYGILKQLYDTRTRTDSAGNEIDRAGLEYWQQKTELSWQHYWDPQRSWRTTTTVGMDWNTDNGGGYFDYRTFRAAEQIRYQAKTWEVRGKVGLAQYDFPVRTIGAPGAPKLHQHILTLNAHAQKKLARFLTVFADYDYEQSVANEPFETYQANTFSGGLEWEF